MHLQLSQRINTSRASRAVNVVISPRMCPITHISGSGDGNAPSQRANPCASGLHSERLSVAARAQATHPAVSAVASETDYEVPAQLRALLAGVVGAPDPKERLRRLMDLGSRLPSLPAGDLTLSNRVMGCTAQVWLTARLDPASGRLQFQGWSDSEVTRGLVALLVEGLSGCTAEEVLQVPSGWVQRQVASGLLPSGPQGRGAGAPGGLGGLLESAKQRVRRLTDPGALVVFPSLRIGADRLEPQGTFAEAQARYLQPDPTQVAALAEQLAAKRVGVVAHFYMDPQVQGVLSSAAEVWPHIAISDSLVMADTAVRMAEAGCRYICVLGVDFMSENVRAILDEAGYRDVQVYRLAEADIGCSLAEAAESQSYLDYLEEAGRTPNSLHVVYINTSLRTKALAAARVPTITCTSSNVVQTVLSAFAEVPDATVWYGPDTYMGGNLAQLFADLAGGQASDEDVRQLHPAHNVESIRALLPRFRYFQSGTCIVHHLFGGEVTAAVRAAYGDAYLAAHFEVPGEMFRLAMEAKRTRNMGVVGSTSNILDFIADKLSQALAAPHPDTLRFVLGTEAGMITSIVRRVQGMLRKAGRTDVEVEIVFPVAPSAITTARQTTTATADQGPVQLPTGLHVVPGPASGEGCSLEGGCAACPYMKMNSLAALMGVCTRLGSPAGEALLEGYRPRSYGGETVGGRSLAAAGCVPILHMRHFQKARALGPELLRDITTRGRGAEGAAAASTA